MMSGYISASLDRKETVGLRVESQKRSGAGIVSLAFGPFHFDLRWSGTAEDEQVIGNEGRTAVSMVVPRM